ncbi:GNAT family N-acetyltransferase [Actinomadura gamaensis]|uniref:GNAT family N-acetyltransferase n=1 Tax=Actinomadura gamaensis TaxID=1763541 RepID=A0ABV9TT36_9ACTN
MTDEYPSSLVVGFGLELRPWSEADLPAMVALFDNPQFARWTPLASPFDLDAARAYVEKSHRERETGRVLQLAVTTDGREPLGEVLYVRRTDEPVTTVELAYGIGPQHQGRGLASRAVRLMTEHVRETIAPERIVLRIAPENVPSQRVARAAGFRLTDDEPVRRPRREGPDIELSTWVADK